MYPSLYGHKTYGRLTQTAGTKIVRCCEPDQKGYTTLTYLENKVAATAHILTVMKPLGYTTIAAANAVTGSDTTWVLTADPGDYTGWCIGDNAIAANDWLVLELDDGTMLVDTVSSVSSLTMTMTTGTSSVQTAAALNRVFFFGIETDTNPFDGLAHARYTMEASGTRIFGDMPGDSIAGFFGSNRRSEPILLVVDNGTNASTLERVCVAYSNKAGRLWNRTTAPTYPAAS